MISSRRHQQRQALLFASLIANPRLDGGVIRTALCQIVGSSSSTVEAMVLEAQKPAILAILLGCGPRRCELAELTLESFQRREERWTIVDLVDKGRPYELSPFRIG